MSLTSLRRCVICYKSMDDSTTLINASLEKQLSVIFFLRKFLKYPLISEEDDVLDSLLIAQGHPSDWIHFCPPCSETVIEAQKVYLNLTEIEAKLTSLRELVESKVAHSFAEFEEEIAVQQSYCDYPDSRTLFTVRQAIFESVKKIKQPVSSPAYLEVNVKEEYLSDEDVDYPDPLLLPEIEECIENPQCQPLTETKDEEDFQNDECLSPSNFIFTLKGQTRASKRNLGNVPTTSQKRGSSYQYKFKTKGPKKSSVESRTCPVCHQIFEKPSLLTRHKRSHVIKGENENLLVKTTTIHELGSQVHYGESNNFLLLATTTSTGEKISGGVADKKDYIRSKRRRIQNRISYIDKSEDESSEDEKGKKYKDSDSEYSYHNFGTENSDSEVSGDEEESMNETEVQFDDPPLSHQLKVQKPRQKKSDPEDRTCPICNKNFTEPRLMRMHLKCMHEKKDYYVCEICGKKYSWPGGLMQHKKEHEDGWIEIKSRYKCTFESCKMAFRHRNDRTRHEKIHFPEKEFSCNLCGASFRFLKSLTRHQKIHSEVKEHLCSICGDSFRHKHNLVRHNLYKHEKDPQKLFVCEQCGKSFKTKTHIDQHLKSKSHGGSGFKTKTSTSATPSKRAKTNPEKMLPPKEQKKVPFVSSC